MNGISYDKALYDCALECACRRRNRRCKNVWDSPACSECTFYVKNYINAEPNQARLFMMQAESQADNLVTGNRGRFIALIIMAVLIIGLIVTCNIKSDVDHKRNMEWIRGLSTSISTDMDKVNAALQTTATIMCDINCDEIINRNVTSDYLKYVKI